MGTRTGKNYPVNWPTEEEEEVHPYDFEHTTEYAYTKSGQKSISPNNRRLASNTNRNTTPTPGKSGTKGYSYLNGISKQQLGRLLKNDTMAFSSSKKGSPQLFVFEDDDFIERFYENEKIKNPKPANKRELKDIDNEFILDGQESRSKQFKDAEQISANTPIRVLEDETPGIQPFTPGQTHRKEHETSPVKSKKPNASNALIDKGKEGLTKEGLGKEIKPKKIDNNQRSNKVY